MISRPLQRQPHFRSSRPAELHIEAEQLITIVFDLLECSIQTNVAAVEPPLLRGFSPHPDTSAAEVTTIVVSNATDKH